MPASRASQLRIEIASHYGGVYFLRFEPNPPAGAVKDRDFARVCCGSVDRE
jgi:hypothetical protein